MILTGRGKERGVVSQESADQPKKAPTRYNRLLQARTIRAIQLTDRRFRFTLTENPGVDNKLWLEATIACWGHLPPDLGGVQGSKLSSQTSWRNLFGVFMRSDNGMFRRRTGGVGGVEGFGGKSGFKRAILWEEEHRLRNNEGPSEARGKGEAKAENTAYSTVQPQRRLLVVAVQPGPDVLTANILQGGTGGYEIGMMLENKENIFIHLDEFGNFHKARWFLPPDLRRSKRGRFPPNCFEVAGDRFSLVKVTKTTSEGWCDQNAGWRPFFTLRKALTWNLHCVDDYANDKRASVAFCAQRDGYLVFSAFMSRENFIEGMERPEPDNRVYCVHATTLKPRYPAMSSKRMGKMKASRVGGNDSDSGFQTIFKWQRTFVHLDADSYPIDARLSYTICNMKLNSIAAVVLIRWNVHSSRSYHEIVGRSFQILDLDTGVTKRVLELPNFHWDFRHHDMTIKYNVMRYYKMRRIYNVRHAGNRSTRVHNDEFTLDDQGRLVCGSHDYCNWIWNINADYDENVQASRVFNPFRNDAGINDLFKTLDDFYWDGEKDSDSENCWTWDTNNERAGWWVKTPNQVLDFWHNVTTSRDGRWFAAVRAGRMFVWDLDDITKVQGFSCAMGTYAGTSKQSLLDLPTATPPTVEKRYLGRIQNPTLKKKLRNWHVWNDMVPEQGLWLMYDDGKVVYLDRDNILEACGLSQEGKQWDFKREDFELNEEDDSEDDDEEVEGESGDENAMDGGMSDGECWYNTEDDNGATTAALRETGMKRRRPSKRRKTIYREDKSDRESYLSLAKSFGWVVTEYEEPSYKFDNEKPEAPPEAWNEIDDEGWLKMEQQQEQQQEQHQEQQQQEQQQEQ